MESLKLLSRFCKGTIINDSTGSQWSQNENHLKVNERNSLNEIMEMPNTESMNVYNVSNKHNIAKTQNIDNSNRSATTTTGDQSSLHTESTPLSSAFSDLENEKFLEAELKDIPFINKRDILPDGSPTLIENQQDIIHAMLSNNKKSREFNPNTYYNKERINFNNRRQTLSHTPTILHHDDMLKNQNALNILYAAANMSNQANHNSIYENNTNLLLDSLLSLCKNKMLNNNNKQSIIDREHNQQKEYFYNKQPMNKNNKESFKYNHISHANYNNNNSISNTIVKSHAFSDIPSDSEMISISANTPFSDILQEQPNASEKKKLHNMKRQNHNSSVMVSINKLKNDIDLDLFYALVPEISNLSDSKKMEYIPKVFKQQNNSNDDVSPTRTMMYDDKEIAKEFLLKTSGNSTRRAYSAPNRYILKTIQSYGLVPNKERSPVTDLNSTIDSISNMSDLNANENTINVESHGTENDIHNQSLTPNGYINDTPLTVEDIFSILGIKEFDDSIFDIQLNDNAKYGTQAAIHVKRNVPEAQPPKENSDSPAHLKYRDVMKPKETLNNKRQETISGDLVHSLKNLFLNLKKQQAEEELILKQEANILHDSLNYVQDQLMNNSLQPPIPTLDHKSMGSNKHPECHPCVFYWGRGCRNGENCEFCHFQHPPKLRRRKGNNKIQ